MFLTLGGVAGVLSYRGRKAFPVGEKNLPILPPWKLFHKPPLSLRAKKGSVAISIFLMLYEIASVVSRPRNDRVTQSHEGEGEYFLLILS